MKRKTKFKRHVSDEPPKEEKVSMSGIAFRQWHVWNHNDGVYFQSREKDHIKINVIGEYGHDQHLAINQGILSDDHDDTSQSVGVRRNQGQSPFGSRARLENWPPLTLQTKSLLF